MGYPRFVRGWMGPGLGLLVACGTIEGGGADGGVEDGAVALDAAPGSDLATDGDSGPVADLGIRADAGVLDAGFASDLAPPDAGNFDTGGADTGPPPDCDYRFGADGVLRIEAEDLPLNGDWETANEQPGFSGSGYILWTGSSSNGRPGNGQMDVRIGVPEAGRYRFQWRNRIGRGDNTTEHNDTWLRFPDAADAYGKRGRVGEESRRYPKPQCEDSTFIEAVRALDNVFEARCARGSTRDGWMKVYSSGARDWRWSTRTSDSDAHDIFVEFDTPGVYTVQLSQRADFHLIDRIVIHGEDVDEAVAEEARPPTKCR